MSLSGRYPSAKFSYHNYGCEAIRRLINVLSHQSQEANWARSLLEEAEMTKECSDFEYDVFISYFFQDRDWVHNWLVPRLEEAEVRVWLDVEGVEPGMQLKKELDRAIKKSHTILLVLTPSFLDSQWSDLESALVEALNLAERQERVIPLLLKPCELPLRLRALTYIDFTRSDQVDSQFSRLMLGIATQGEPRGTTLPVVPAYSTIDYNLGVVRQLLTAAFSDSELTTLSFDHFQAVYQDFSTGMSKMQKTQMLIEYCERHAVMDQLLSAIRERNPAQYRRFEDELGAKR
jgi:hypothetical protein